MRTIIWAPKQELVELQSLKVGEAFCTPTRLGFPTDSVCILVKKREINPLYPHDFTIDFVVLGREGIWSAGQEVKVFKVKELEVEAHL